MKSKPVTSRTGEASAFSRALPSRGRDLYGIPGAAQPWGVGQIEVGDVGDHGAAADRNA